MKLSLLNKIVSEEAYKLKERAVYSGACDDGGCHNLLNKLDYYKQNFVIEMNLRPTEYSKIYDIEVGEPAEFSKIIEKYKIKLAKNIVL